MGLEHRPYVGTWKLNGMKIVQYTPDALVYLNGDTTLPGCSGCSGRIDFQKYLTELSVDAGTDPGSASASLSLSIPVHSTDSFARDAKFLLRPGMEIHAYMRAYFPVKGMFQSLAQPVAAPIDLTGGDSAFQTLQSSGTPVTKWGKSLDDINFDLVSPGLVSKWHDAGMRTDLPDDYGRYAVLAAGSAEVLEQYWRQKYPDAQVIVTSHHRHEDGAGLNGNHSSGCAFDFKVTYEGGAKTVPMIQTWGSIKKVADSGRIPPGGTGMYLNVGPDGVKGAKPSQAGKPSRPGAPPGGSAGAHYDLRGTYGFKPKKTKGESWVWLDLDSDGKDDIENNTQQALGTLRSEGLSDVVAYYRGGWAEDDFLPPVSNRVPNLLQVLGQQEFDTSGGSLYIPPDPTTGQAGIVGESLLESVGLQDSGIEDLMSYPYYHVFHGVVTQVSHSWSGGANNVSISCSSMLHFWQYHNMSANASIFGARPTNSKLKSTLVGSNFTGMHPYEIMYTLHHDTAGAAGGVAWALSQKTNQSAVSEVAGESLFSLNLRYWERRFSTRMTRLRMHGATGALFSTAQATYLSRLSSSALSKAVRDRFANPSTRKNPQKKILSASQAVNLGNKDKLRGLQENGEARTPTEGASLGDLVFAERSSERGIEIVLPEMVAFVSNISEWGQVNLFESTYESKLDVAQKVCEVTGFEFYQDVDGDFVFKPPMYNLDTSESRIYRIEDIDIISISFEEKEPEVTYMTVKGSHFKNLQVGIDNEWGVQGQYIDYRLVAQFGWRPQAFETAYFNDPRSMFFAAVNRMDVLNAPVNSGTVTIPLRPELRPGYPVYIPFVDAFYYCNSFAHSYSVGGQCTTTLQLVAKRSKFYAPGDPRKNGIEAISLGNTLLPERPLETLDETGKPRLEGFPNVVMALDPDQINPMFFVVGSDLERYDDPQFIGNLVKQAADLKIIRATGYLEGNPEAVVYSIDVPAGVDANGNVLQGEKQFVFHRVDLNETPPSRVFKAKGDYTDLMKVAAAYAKDQRADNKSIATQRKQISVIQDKIDYINAQMRDLDPSTPAERKKLRALEEERFEQEKLRARAVEGINDTQRGIGESIQRNPEYAVLIELVAQVGEHALARHRDYTDLNSTVNLLDMLSDKKATFSNGTQPGAYRYYSASHPNPAEQGQPLLTYDNMGGGKSHVLKTKPSLDKPLTVRGFLPQNRVYAPFPGAKIPESVMGDIEAVNGIRILTSDPRFPSGEIKPTSEIRELSFAVQKSRLRRQSTSSTGASKSNVFTSKARKTLQNSFIPDYTPQPSSSLVALFSGPWEDKAAKVAEAVQEARARASVLDRTRQPPTMVVPVFPTTVVLRGVKVPTGDTFSALKFPARLQRTMTPSVISEQGSSALGTSFFNQLQSAVFKYQKAFASNGYSKGAVSKIMDTLHERLSSVLGVPAAVKGRRKQQRTTSLKSDIYSPVFPVSDARGYTVIGSYRYGRDIAIDPDGVWDSLHRQDPLSMLDRKSVEDLLTVVVDGGTVTVDRETVDSRGRKKVVKERLTRESSLRYVERQLLRQLRQNLSDQDIIDLFKLKVNDQGEPEQLALGLMNHFADQRDGISKLPIANAAFSLADLSLHTSQEVCSCKAAEASLQLEAFGRQDFIEVSSGTSLQEGQDPLMSFLTSEATRQGEPWRRNQDALRGRILDRAGSGLARSFVNVVERYRGLGQRDLSALEGTAQNVADTVEDL